MIDDGETERIVAGQVRKRKLGTLLFLVIMCSCFILAHVAVTWVVRVERAPEGFGGKLLLVEIVDGNYVFVGVMILSLIKSMCLSTTTIACLFGFWMNQWSEEATTFTTATISLAE